MSWYVNMPHYVCIIQFYDMLLLSIWSSLQIYLWFCKRFDLFDMIHLFWLYHIQHRLSIKQLHKPGRGTVRWPFWAKTDLFHLYVIWTPKEDTCHQSNFQMHGRQELFSTILNSNLFLTHNNITEIWKIIVRVFWIFDPYQKLHRPT
jgi:hypothetical protein